jgi:hypothetical protein
VCEYPDSNKILLDPSGEIFGKNAAMGNFFDAPLSYFDGEENVQDKWKEVEKKKG